MMRDTAIITAAIVSEIMKITATTRPVMTVIVLSVLVALLSVEGKHFPSLRDENIRSPLSSVLQP